MILTKANMSGGNIARAVTFLAAICLLALFACRAEQPEVQIAIEATSTPTAVSTSSTIPTQLTPTPTGEITPTPPTATPSLLPTRPTIRDFIKEAGVSPAGLGTDILEQRIIAFEPLNSERSFLLGYFVESPENGELPDELHFLRFDRATQSWFATVLQEPEYPEGEACHPSVCYGLGVVTSYLESPRFYFAYMHLNPSAGWTAVLTPELELNTVLFGRVRAVFADGTAVYIYRGVRNGNLEFREVSEAELTQLFGPYELADLLEADRLERIFTEVTFIE